MEFLSDLVGGEDLAREECLGDAAQGLAVFFEERFGLGIGGVDGALDLLVNQASGGVAVLAGAEDLAAPQGVVSSWGV